MTKIQIVREQLIKKRGYFCEMCGDNRDLQVHHWLYHRMKNKPELDCEENCALLCDRCHDNYANAFESRRHFWQVQIERYGKDHMQKWHENLSLKVKQRFD